MNKKLPRVIITVKNFPCRKNSTLTASTIEDQTKPALKPDAKIRRMTGSNCYKCWSVLCRAPAPAQDCQKRSGGVLADNDPLHIEQHTRWNVLRELSCFPRGRNHRTPPISIPRDPEVETAPRWNPNYPNRHLARWSEAHATWHRRTKELLLNLVRSETRPTSDAGSRHPSRTANAKPFFRCIRTDADVDASEDSNHFGEDIRFHQMLFAPYAQLTTAFRKPNTTPAQT